MFFHKKNRYELDMTTANNALQNILSSCNQPVNTIPFDKLVLRKKVNAASYNRLIVATTLIFVLTFLSPLAIVPLSEMTEKLLAPIIEPLSVDSSKGVINFPFLSEEANIYVPVKNGETLHLLFTPDNVTGLEQ